MLKFKHWREENEKNDIASGVLLVLVVLLWFPLAQPASVRAPTLSHLQFNFYNSQAAAFTALSAGLIDMMDCRFTHTQYTVATTDPGLTLAPVSEHDIHEIAFNVRLNDPSHLPIIGWKAMSDQFFRQAVACLVDKRIPLAVPSVAGFGTRIDTPVPRPCQEQWVDLASSFPTYPWEYDTTGVPNTALWILYVNNWYDDWNNNYYPTFASLLAAYSAHTLLPGPYGVIYPPGHTRAASPVDALVGYIRNDDPSLNAAGAALVTELTNMGIPVLPTYGPAAACLNPVFYQHDYDFYTNHYVIGIKPLHFYTYYTPAGDYPGGPNIYGINDPALTAAAWNEYPGATSFAASMTDAVNCQWFLAHSAYLVTLYSTRSYIAYNSAFSGMINYREYDIMGLSTQASMGYDFAFMNMRSKYFPAVDTIYFGTMSVPDMLNPIFSSSQWDYDVLDAIFTDCMHINPYKPSIPDKSPVGGDLPWMVDDWLYTPLGTTSTVDLWIRNDIHWHDGVLFNVDDIGYTISLMQAYSDSYNHAEFMNIAFWTSSLANFYHIRKFQYGKHLQPVHVPL
jgi:hypothetical protein